MLRNLQDKRNVDERYDTIMRHMAEAFPMFDDIVLEQTGPSSVYASLMERGDAVAGYSHPALPTGSSNCCFC